MLIDGIEYQLVEKGTVENTFIFGVAIGLMMIGLIVALYWIGRRNLFAKYYRHLTGESRKTVMQKIEEMQNDADELANDTNTNYFKSLANEFHALMAELKRH